MSEDCQQPVNVLVTNGQPVTTNEVIASIELPEKHLEINILDQLEVELLRVDKTLAVRVGDPVRVGTLIARKGGLLAKTVTSPVDGRIVEITNGRVIVEHGSNPIVVKAGFTGTVREVIPNFGAIITSGGALLQGVWGNQRMAEGLMICMARNRIEELTPERMDVIPSWIGCVWWALHEIRSAPSSRGDTPEGVGYLGHRSGFVGICESG